MSTAVHFEFDEVAHRYSLEGRPILSATQILTEVGLSDFSMVPTEVLDRAAHLGKLVHQACHFYDRDALQPEETLPDEVRIRLNAYKQFRKDSGYVPQLNEVRSIAVVGKVNPMEFGMTFDSVGHVGAVPWLVDLKCGVKQPSWEIQLAAYELGIGKPLPHLHYHRTVIQLRDDGSYRTHHFNDDGAFDVWRASYLIAVKPDWATFAQFRAAEKTLRDWRVNHA